MKNHLASLTLTLSVLTAASASAQVLVVDDTPGPGIDYAEISDAVAAAVDGTFILVRQGTYAPFVVDGKALTIAAPNGASVFDLEFEGVPIRIENTTPEQTVVLRSVTVVHVETDQAHPLLSVDGCAGTVLIENAFYDSLGAGSPATVTDSDSVVFRSCLLQNAGFSGEAAPPPGLDVTNSRVYFFDSTTNGAQGAAASLEDGVLTGPTDGGPAVRLRGASLIAYGADLRGGAGGGHFVTCGPGGDGGDGILLESSGGTDSSARVFGSAPAGGSPGGNSQSCAASVGQDGLPFSGTGGTFELTFGTPRAAEFDSVAEEGTALTTSYTGITGDVVLLAVGLQPLPGQHFPALGIDLNIAPFLFVTVATVPSPPVLTQEIVTPILPPGLSHLTLYSQAFFVDAQASLFQSGPLSSVIVDSNEF